MMRYPRIQKVSVFFAVVVFFALCPHYAQAGNWSLWTNVGAGDSSSITGDITLRYAFSPLYQNSSIELRPLGEASAVYWQHETDNDEWGGGLSVGLQLVFIEMEAGDPIFPVGLGAFSFPIMILAVSILVEFFSFVPRQLWVFSSVRISNIAFK